MTGFSSALGGDERQEGDSFLAAVRISGMCHAAHPTEWLLIREYQSGTIPSISRSGDNLGVLAPMVRIR